MQRLSWVVSLGIALAASACAKHAPDPPPSPPPGSDGSGEVLVTLEGFENETGKALVALFLNERGWPDDESVAFGSVSVPISDGRATAEFRNVPAGSFAVSAFHDENEDEKLDTGIFGIPAEAYGFSRDARNTFGPASFDESRMELAAGESLSVTIHVH